ncbi:MAG: ankyrin repeat domain-containing protein [Novosphingobium sp.]
MAPLKRPLLIAFLIALIAAPAGAETSPAYDEARDLVLAGKVGPALMVIGVGAMGINDQDDSGFTLLHHAVKTDSLESVRELLRAGADPQVKASDGSTPLMLATSDAIRAVLAAAISQPRTP